MAEDPKEVEEPDDNNPEVTSQSLAEREEVAVEKPSRPHLIKHESVRTYVIRKPALVLSFENLTVHVPGGKHKCCTGGPL